METEKIINDKIMSITNQIRTKYPELLIFLNEMPVTLPTENNPEINVPILKSYYDSLLTIFNDYDKEHERK